MQNYIMVGAGGTGTHFLPGFLTYVRNFHANEGTEYTVVIADGDIFEERNLARQLFAEGLVTLNKAAAMLQMYPGHPIIAVSRYIGKADVEQMIQDTDIVLICADNFSIRALIAQHVASLKEAVVINGGNEINDGSVQLWVRQKGKNKTPAITYAHPEIQFLAEDDRSTLTCAQAAQLPGGEQTILANMTTAVYMLAALHRFHSGDWQERGNGKGWTELQFDTQAGKVDHLDLRERKNWQANPK